MKPRSFGLIPINRPALPIVPYQAAGLTRYEIYYLKQKTRAGALPDQIGAMFRTQTNCLGLDLPRIYNYLSILAQQNSSSEPFLNRKGENNM